LNLPNTVTYRLFPKAKGEILVRFENLADNFDKSPAESQINLKDFATALYLQVNNKNPKYVGIKEMDLQGVNKHEKRKSYWYKLLKKQTIKLKLKSVDQSRNKNNKYTSVHLKPMQLRTFLISYKAPVKKEKKAIAPIVVAKTNKNSTKVLNKANSSKVDLKKK
jgi:hypothetical protein